MKQQQFLLIFGPAFVGRSQVLNIILQKYRRIFTQLGQIIGREKRPEDWQERIYDQFVTPQYFEQFDGKLFYHWKEESDGIRRGILKSTLTEIVDNPIHLIPVATMSAERGLDLKRQLEEDYHGYVKTLFVDSHVRLITDVIDDRFRDQEIRNKYYLKIVRERTEKDNCDHVLFYDCQPKELVALVDESIEKLFVNLL